MKPNEPDLRSLLDAICSLIDSVETKAHARAQDLRDIAPEFAASAVNLLHYLTLRSLDLETLQTQLQRAGLSSLGHSEGQVLANLKQIANRLSHCIDLAPQPSISSSVPVDWAGAELRIQTNAAALFGRPPPGRRAFIMVTAPDKTDDDAMDALFDAGMNCLRVNCAHGSQGEWRATIECARAAAQRRQKDLKIFMDLAGPKVRTGPIQPGPQVIKASPLRSELGETIEPVSLSIGRVSGPSAIGFPAEFLEQIQAGDSLKLVDTRGRKRRFVVKQVHGALYATSDRTVYFGAETRVKLLRGEKEIDRCRIEPPPHKSQKIDLVAGDRILLTARQMPGVRTARSPLGVQVDIPQIACSFPEALADVNVGAEVYFDDGKFRGVVIQKIEKDLLIEILWVQGTKGKLNAEKGINFPDSHISCAAITPSDLEILKTVVELADGVELSFVNKKEDVHLLRQELARLGKRNFPLILKIETNSAFHNLAEIVLEAMREYPVGVMIARGDLAVECGFERLAELQEEIMWVCESAHVPVIWATQVLESLAKTGVPTRAEVSDAAMAGRAECVMLNKGPFIVDAVATLARILEKMKGHQSKKSSVMRALHFGKAAAPGK